MNMSRLLLLSSFGVRNPVLASMHTYAHAMHVGGVHPICLLAFIVFAFGRPSWRKVLAKELPFGMRSAILAGRNYCTV